MRALMSVDSVIIRVLYYKKIIIAKAEWAWYDGRVTAFDIVSGMYNLSQSYIYGLVL